MLTSARNRSRTTIACAALFAVYAGAAPFERRPDDYIGRARGFIRTFYPGLNGQLKPVITGNRLSETDEMSFFTIQLCDLEPKDTKGPAVCWCSDPALSVDFVFDWHTENKELVRLGSWGPAVDGRRHKFAEEMKKHAKWSEAQVVAALAAAGAKFGPDQKAEFLRALPIEELRPFVGGQLEVTSAVFLLGTSPDGESEKADPVWRVEANWHGAEGQEKRCLMLFDPFEGRIWSLLLLGGPETSQPEPAPAKR